MTNNNTYRLGLDLGTNSIGWAMLALNENNEPHKIIDIGVRIFSDGRDPQSKEPLAVARRIARGARRRRDRFLARKEKLMNYLIKIGLMPEDELERKKLELLNPYELRTKALDQALQPYELGRAIFHLNQRRGFKEIDQDNSAEAVDEEENGKKKVKKENAKIKDDKKRTNLEKAIEANKCRTLGEYLFKFRLEYLDKKEPQKNQNQGLTTRSKPDEKALYPTRAMYENELQEIQKFQQKFQKINEENWEKIKEIIFYQRKLKPQDKGFCQFINEFKIKKLPIWAKELFDEYLKKHKAEFEQQKDNKEQYQKPKGLPRAYKALPSYQKFIILSEVNNLKLIDKKTGKDVLILSDRQKIITKLMEQKSPATFKSLRKLIEAKIKSYPEGDYQFNLESGRRSELEANKTNALMFDEKHFGTKWNEFSLIEQDEIVEFLFEEEDEKEIATKALNEWNLSQIQAENLSKLTIKTSVGMMCKEILQKLCTKIEEENKAGNNCLYNQALEKLEIKHSDEEYANDEEAELSYYAAAIPASVVKVKSGSKEEEEYGKIANPTVHIALNQIRKVVNSLIEEHGKPAEIHIELARGLQLSKKAKDALENFQRDNKKQNDELKKELIDNKIAVTDDNILKLKLWKELDPKDCNDRKCPYCGKKNINIHSLSSSEIEIEHILPKSRTFDDSYNNKTVAHKSCNNLKKNQSPFEAFNGKDGFNYDEILDRAEKLPKQKRWRFYENAMTKVEGEKGFLARQLNDTRYLSRISTQYLSQICKKDKIRVANGSLTAVIRDNWGLNAILKPTEKPTNDQSPQTTNYDPITGEIFENEDNNSKQKVKKNRDDHRHHAIDAFCVAMTTRSLVKEISEYNKAGKELKKFTVLPPRNWNRFYEDVKDAIDKIAVSHRIDHGLNSEFHSQTYYGILKQPIDDDSCKITSLKKEDIDDIIDEEVRDKLQKLTALIPHKKQTKENKAELKLILRQFTEESGIKYIQIKKAKNDPFNVIYSKPGGISSLNKNEINRIRDKNIKKKLEELTKNISDDQKKLAPVLQKFSKETGIKNVRILEKIKTAIKIEHGKNQQFSKAISPDAKHHISIWRMPNGKFETKVVSNFEINSLYKIEKSNSVNIINKKNKIPKKDWMNFEALKPHPAAKLIIRISKDDMIRLEEDGKLITAKITCTPDSTQCSYVFHNDITKTGTFYANENSLRDKKIRKIFVTPTGKVFDSGAILE